MNDIEIKDVPNMEQLELKITELKNKDSLYLIEVNQNDVSNLYRMMTEMGFKNVIFFRRMPNVKEIKKAVKENE